MGKVIRGVLANSWSVTLSLMILVVLCGYVAFQSKALAQSNDRVKGIDVSDSQSTISWKDVFDSGYKFAFVKASSGNDVAPLYIDDRFVENMENSRKVPGLVVGAYHFACPDNGNTAVSEAQHFLNVAGKYLGDGYLRPALDLECGGEVSGECINKVILAKEDLSDWVDDWMATVVSETGVQPILYTRGSYKDNYLNSTMQKYDLWFAQYTCSPDGKPNVTPIWHEDDWDFWQYYEPQESNCGPNAGTVPGVEKDVDLDVFNGNEDRLKSFLIEVRALVTYQPDSLVLSPGESGTIRFDVQNIANIPWTTKHGFFLTNVNCVALNVPSAIPLANQVPIGQVATWEIPIIAPEDIGVYTIEWQMTHYGVPISTIMSCKVIVEPEGESNFDPFWQLKQLFNDLIQQIEQWFSALIQLILEGINAWWETQTRRFNEWLQSELQRRWREFWEKLLLQCCGPGVVLPGVAILGTLAGIRARRKR